MQRTFLISESDQERIFLGAREYILYVIIIGTPPPPTGKSVPLLSESIDLPLRIFIKDIQYYLTGKIYN